ncbi:MAG TPA: hypothetical protein VEG30_13250 [Terriglobales bacterium]|nr:hypothetical protein [Terriglobales bacterium]
MKHAIVRVAALFASLISTALMITIPALAAPLPQVPKVTVPAGTRILIRMIDSVDSSKQQVGYRFTASLETNLQVDDMVVAPRGSTVYGRLNTAEKAGRMSGGAELTLELTDIVINGTAYPLMTSDYVVRSEGKGKKTARRVVGGTGLGALIGGIAGGGAGAAIGALSGAAAGTALSAASGGKQVSVPSESLLEFQLEHPVALPAAQ